MLVEVDGIRILMDPWLTDPTYHGTWWHYPPLQLGVRDLPKIDYLYVSHEHPDHFDPPTLAQLDKNVHLVIGNFARKRFRDRLAAIGFRRISELDFATDFPCDGGRMTLRLIKPDRPWDDSAILVRDGQTTLLNVNDCHLDQATLSGLGRDHSIDIAFLTFTGASQYPGCFDFSLASKIERARYSKTGHLEEFVNWARLLRTKRAVPAAGNQAFLAEDQLFLNNTQYANTPAEAIEALRAGAPEIEGLQMNPGDVWTAPGTLERRRPAPDWSRRMEDIEEMSRAARGRIAESFGSEPAAPDDLYERFQCYFDERIGARPAGLRAGRHRDVVDGDRRAGRRVGDRLPARRRLGAARRSRRLESAHHDPRQAGLPRRHRARDLGEPGPLLSRPPGAPAGSLHGRFLDVVLQALTRAWKTG